MRAGQDIDMLVPYETLPAAMTRALTIAVSILCPHEAQLRMVMPLRQDFGFVHESTGARIELHWRLFLNPHAITEDSIMEASRVVRLTGSEGLRTLGEEDLFAYLCMHGALHWWYRLKWLADVNALLAALSAGGVVRLLRAAEARGRRACRRTGPPTLPATSGDAPPRPTNGDAGQRCYGALVGGYGVERRERWPRRA
jgi:hypothetical protein